MEIEEHVMLFITFIAPVFIASIILYLIRALRGPTIPDMVIAVDAISFDIAVFLAVLAVYFKSPILISCVIVLMLWAYALDIYVAKYLESKDMGG
ncbi:MAG: monovalent cation/H+ antiporter complex subunit F [Ignisphaera sp.]|nr:monovalent cation/H+ antiporter complex subunit F [Ignisphaera sp.]MCX8167879.1 monovalent cation/H+ antiporter complex subunit F [Ignisphaera sp.]MDW8085480.1 monovalent cation/H+ antiporter complex subunit F [Ignisphaera sp.]